MALLVLLVRCEQFRPLCFFCPLEDLTADSLGGVFSDYVTWRWCFYINLPFGGVTILFLAFFLPDRPPTTARLPWKEQVRQFDLPGTFFLIPSVISLLLALQWGGAKYPWNNGRIIALFVVFGVLAIAFWLVQLWQGENATVPLRIVKNKNILAAAWYGIFLGAAIFVFTYYLPIWFQAIEGVSATQSGIRNLPSILGLVLFAIIGGGIATALGQYVPLLLVSSVIASVGSGLLTTLNPGSTIGYWFGYQILFAAGAGLGAQNVMLVPQVAVPLTDMAQAFSLLSFAQTLSSSIFLAVAQTVFQNVLIADVRREVPGVDPNSVVAGGVTALRTAVSPDQLPGLLRAYNGAIVATFYVATAASALSILGPLFMDWLSLKTPEKKEADPSTSATETSTVDGPSAERKSGDGASAERKSGDGSQV